MNTHFALENPIEVITGKKRSELTRDDLINIINKKQIERITFHYTAIDGRVKELRLPITSHDQAELILAEGERVDGSSLFKGVVDAGKSDLYVIPVYKSAFINPFDETSLDFICRFVTGDGELAPFAPDNLLYITHQKLKEEFDMEFNALGELEFYLIGNSDENLYPLPNQKGYHGSSPYVKTTDIVNEMLRVMTNITSEIKYAHNEVGLINSLKSDNPLLDGKLAEQVEIEFLPSPIEDAADIVVLGKWLCQSIANQYGLIATFYPKIQLGDAGSANTHMLLAAMTTAVLWAFRNPEESLKLADENYIAGNIHSDPQKVKEMIDIATSCVETAEKLDEYRDYYEKDGYFTKTLIDKVIELLKAENDSGLNKKILSLPEEDGRLLAEDFIKRGFSKY